MCAMNFITIRILSRLNVSPSLSAASSVEQLITSLCTLSPSLYSPLLPLHSSSPQGPSLCTLWQQQQRFCATHAAHAQEAARINPTFHKQAAGRGTVHHQEHELELYGNCSSWQDQGGDMSWSWQKPATCKGEVWEENLAMPQPTSPTTPPVSARHVPNVPALHPAPSPALPPTTSHPEHQPPRAEQLFEAYLELCSKHTPQITSADKWKHFELFKQQLLSELRAGEQAAERYLKRQVAFEKFGTGQTPAKKRLRPLALEWMKRLQRALEQEFSKAMAALSPPVPSSDEASDIAAASDISSTSSQLTLWPIMAAAGSENVATTVVAGTLHAIMPYMGSFNAQNTAGAKACENWSVPAISLAEALGSRLEELVLHQQLHEELLINMRLKKSGQSHYSQGQQRLRKMRDLAQNVETRIGSGAGLSHQALSSLLASINHVKHKQRWNKAHKLQVGGELLNLLIRESVLPNLEGETVQGLHYEAVPMYKNKEIKKYGTIIVHELVPWLLLQDGSSKQLLGSAGSMLHDSRMYPMLIPPVPWTSYDSGGLIMHGSSAVRAYRRNIFIQADKAGQMAKLYDGLNALNSLPWVVNTKVLEVMEALWASLPPSAWRPPPHAPSTSTHAAPATSHTTTESKTSAGGAQLIPEDLLAKMPTAWQATAACSMDNSKPGVIAAAAVPLTESTPHLRSTREGRSLGQLLFTAGPLTQNEERDRRRRWLKMKQTIRDNSIQASELLLKLQVARHLAGHERFYIPHNIDFRGRAYPTSCYLHQLGDDTSRGLLLFAEAKPLGQRGLEWLFIQVAKCYGNGKDKLPFEERRSFGEDHLSSILASARAPLQPGESQWWLQAEEPWQLLATCMEINAALNSGNPETYLSRVPLQQDGTCNGLQHYAALARDYEGAFSVNLVPSPAPQDVYSAVSKVVDAQVRKDAEQGSNLALKYLARCGSVDRKIVKQTVMTSVYGVTNIGARQQIEARLEERGWDNKDDVYTVSSYLSTLTLSSIGELFKNAEAVRSWLSICAGAVASTGRPVEWKSPLGFPILQPYFEAQHSLVECSLQRFWVQKPSMKVAKRSQKTAFPPNYIHSLDSAHMMMTAMKCKEQGVAFAGVHDCFWTHAATADTLGTILRDTFVQLHSRPLLDNLVEDLKAAAPGVVLPPIPPKGHLDLEVIRASPYFFC